MQLFDNSSRSGFIPSNHHKNIFGVKIHTHEIQDDFHMSHTLNPGADLILAFYNQYAVSFQNTLRFVCRPNI